MKVIIDKALGGGRRGGGEGEGEGRGRREREGEFGLMGLKKMKTSHQTEVKYQYIFHVCYIHYYNLAFQQAFFQGSLHMF